MYAAEVSLQITVKDSDPTRICPVCNDGARPSDRLLSAIKTAWQERVYTSGLVPSYVEALPLGENLYTMNLVATAPTRDAAERFVSNLQPQTPLRLIEDTHADGSRLMKFRLTDSPATVHFGFTKDIYEKLTEVQT